MNNILNQLNQRAGLLAIISGIMETCPCVDTKETTRNILEHIFREYPVGDEIEQSTLLRANNCLKEVENMMDQIRNILKDSSN